MISKEKAELLIKKLVNMETDNMEYSEKIDIVYYTLNYITGNKLNVPKWILNVLDGE